MADPSVGKPVMAGNSQMELITSVVLNKRRMIRTTKNPMDKCTLVSIYPRPVDDIKVTLEDAKYHIDPGTYDKPALSVIGASCYWRDIDWEQPLLQIPVSSVSLAESIIKDYCNGYLGCDMGEAMPGLFFVLGEVENPMEVKMKYKKKLDEVKRKQDNWYTILVRLADSLWARGNGNPLVIWDDMRLAAREMGLDKPWLKDYQVAELIRCVFCGGMRNPAFPICPSCHAVDPNHPLAGQIKFAQ